MFTQNLNTGPAILFLKSKKISEQPGMVLINHRWHQINKDAPVPDHDPKYALHKQYDIQAAKKLTQDAGFNDLHPDEQLAKIKQHGQGLQDKATSASKVYLFSKHVLSGTQPVNSEWKAFLSLPKEQQLAVIRKITAVAGGKALFDSAVKAFRAAHAKHQEQQVAESKAVDNQKSQTPKAEVNPGLKLESKKEKPKTTPTAEAKKPKPKKSDYAKIVEALNSARLPETNTNAKTVNGKIDKLIPLVEAGDTAAIKVFPYGSNKYGMKLKKITGVAVQTMTVGKDEVPAAAPKQTEPKAQPKAKAEDNGPKEGAAQTVNGIEYVLRGGRWHRVTPDDKQSAKRSKKGVERKPKNTLETGGEFTDDDPNSPNYRFRDTGYIGGSRKEMAAESIRRSGRDGTQLRATDIDWVEIEKNHRQAKDLIIKSNIFGKVDWDSLKSSGMEPGAGFLVDRIYASIAPEPSEDSPQARHDYAIGLESLRDRLERCKTPSQITDTLNEIRDEFEGVTLNAEESEKYQQAQAALDAVYAWKRKLEAEKKPIDQEAQAALNAYSSLKWEQEKRAGRKWKSDPKLDAAVHEAEKKYKAALKVSNDWKDAHPELEEKTVAIDDGNGGTRFEYRGVIRDAIHQAYKAREGIVVNAKIRNQLENPLHRAWMTMGQKFINVINYRRSNGSDVFAKHVTAAKTGMVNDWSWAEKDRQTGPNVTKGNVRFQLKVAEKMNRLGGREVKVESTDALKAKFGLRDVQSGNWVLQDPKAAAFHVQKSAEAFCDLADLIGVPEHLISMNGRLALAIGARGHGNAGFGGAARAHYEPVERVINMTKMGGGGCLGHEWLHALDNMVKEVSTGLAVSKDEMVTDNPAILPAGELRDAVTDLHRAMWHGDKRTQETFRYTYVDLNTARLNLDRDVRFMGRLPRSIKSAGSADAAVLAVDAFYEGRTDRKSKIQRKRWRVLAAAYYDGNEKGGKVSIATGPSGSSFAYEAVALDQGSHGKYWSKSHEMAARAFQAWCEDRLSGQGRKNDYLSAYADNKYYVDPLFGDTKPFPEGDERERINKAYDKLFDVIRSQNLLQKALELTEIRKDMRVLSVQR